MIEEKLHNMLEPLENNILLSPISMYVTSKMWNSLKMCGKYPKNKNNYMIPTQEFLKVNSIRSKILAIW